MIGNLIVCKKCGEELQPENLLVGTSPDGKLTRKCCFCGFEEVVERDLKTLKDLRIEEELCEKLDTEVYLPVKKELEGIDKTYSLGAKKEDFKGLIEKKFNELRQSAIKDIKFFRKNRSSNPEYSKEELNGVEKYIKWKFNIEEEDLKND